MYVMKGKLRFHELFFTECELFEVYRIEYIRLFGIKFEDILGLLTTSEITSKFLHADEFLSSES